MEKTGCKIIYGAPAILAVKELMMMMMMMMMMMIMNCFYRTGIDRTMSSACVVLCYLLVAVAAGVLLPGVPDDFNRNPDPSRTRPLPLTRYRSVHGEAASEVGT